MALYALMTFRPPIVSSVRDIRREFISCTTLEVRFSRRAKPATTSATSGSIISTNSVSFTFSYTSIAMNRTMLIMDDSSDCSEPRTLSSYSTISLLKRAITSPFRARS